MTDKLKAAIVAAGIKRNIIEEGAPVTDDTLLNIVACLGMGPKMASAEAAVAWMWEYIGKDVMRRHIPPVARAIHEMDPHNPPYPKDWKPVAPLYVAPQAVSEKAVRGAALYELAAVRRILGLLENRKGNALTETEQNVLLGSAKNSAIKAINAINALSSTPAQQPEAPPICPNCLNTRIEKGVYENRPCTFCKPSGHG